MKKFHITKMILIISIAVTAFGYAVMLLWNALIPELFGGPAINFLQAIGLLVLSKILFYGAGRWRGRNYMGRYRWREAMEQRMKLMTPEERDQFREHWKQRCCGSWKWKPATPDQPGTAA